jgi:hypothetical protein
MDGMIKTVTSNNVIYCDVTINPPLCTIVTSGCGGPRTHEPLFTRFSHYSPVLLVNVACCILQEIVFSANGIAYNNILHVYDNENYVTFAARSALLINCKLFISSIGVKILIQ